MAAVPSEDPEGSGGDSARLVERIRSGDPNADRELVERFGRGLMILLRRSSRNRGDADDLYQETFRVALEKIRRGGLREPEKLAGFLAGIARNLVIEHYRRSSARPVESDDRAARDLADTATGPLEKLLRLERVEIVRRVLSELDSERDRQILFRFYLAEEDKRLICADLGLSSLHFNRVLFRARQRFRELFTELAGKDNGAG